MCIRRQGEISRQLSHPGHCPTAEGKLGYSHKNSSESFLYSSFYNLWAHDAFRRRESISSNGIYLSNNILVFPSSSRDVRGRRTDATDRVFIPYDLVEKARVNALSPSSEQVVRPGKRYSLCIYRSHQVPVWHEREDGEPTFMYTKINHMYTHMYL